MPHKVIKMTLLILLAVLAVPDSVNAQQSSFKRVLSISTIPQLEPYPLTDSDFSKVFTSAVELVANAGVTGNVYTQHWNEIEPTKGRYKLDDLKNTVDYLGRVKGFDLFFGIQVINTVTREVPDDLKDVSFDSEQMKERFHALIDAITPNLEAHVRYISIGNEVDQYLEDNNEWTTYTVFYDDAVAYIHKVLPHIKVGVTVGFDGLTKAWLKQIQALNKVSDVIIVTYYPLNPDFTVQRPDAPLTDFPLMLQQTNNRPLLIQEIGYPASQKLNSSEQLQAQFVQNVFTAWADTGNQVPFVNFFLLHDFTKAMCNQFLIYYGLPNSSSFYEYLCTLGLRQANGIPRQAWWQFVDSAKHLKSSGL